MIAPCKFFKNNKKMIDHFVREDFTRVLKFKTPPLIKTSSQNFSGDSGEIKTAREKLRAKKNPGFGLFTRGNRSKVVVKNSTDRF